MLVYVLIGMLVGCGVVTVFVHYQRVRRIVKTTRLFP